MAEVYTAIFLGILFMLLVFFLLREVNCWYLKINERVALAEENNRLLKELIQMMGQQNGSTFSAGAMSGGSSHVGGGKNKTFVTNDKLFGSKTIQLPPPDQTLSDFLSNDNFTLKHMIESYEDYIGEIKNESFPIYFALELDRRGQVIDQKSLQSLDRYAVKKGYSSFSKMLAAMGA